MKLKNKNKKKIKEKKKYLDKSEVFLENLDNVKDLTGKW